MTCHRLDDDGALAELDGTIDAHVETCDDCRARRGRYERIAGMIAAGVTGHRLPADWNQRTLARVRAVRIARRRRTVTAAVAGAALAIVGFLIVRGREPPRAAPQLAMQIVAQAGWRGEAHSGEELRARAMLAGEPYFEIRVYRGARELLVRCPAAGPPECLDPDRSLLVWRIPSVGTYQVVLLVSQQAIAAPRGSLDDDVAAATAAGARTIDVQTLHVR